MVWWTEPEVWMHPLMKFPIITWNVKEKNFQGPHPSVMTEAFCVSPETLSAIHFDVKFPVKRECEGSSRREEENHVLSHWKDFLQDSVEHSCEVSLLSILLFATGCKEDLYRVFVVNKKRKLDSLQSFLPCAQALLIFLLYTKRTNMNPEIHSPAKSESHNHVIYKNIEPQQAAFTSLGILCLLKCMEVRMYASYSLHNLNTQLALSISLSFQCWSDNCRIMGRAEAYICSQESEQVKYKLIKAVTGGELPSTLDVIQCV